MSPHARLDGVLLIDKPAGLSSAEVTNRLKKKFRFDRIGHGGTLDPFATGLLIVLIGEATKVARFLLEGDKEYEAVAALGCPSILKTADFGYDGKGQVRIDAPHQAAAAWQTIGCRDAVLEGFISFAKEVSVVAARSVSGDYADFGVVENTHRHHILDLTAAPADVSPRVQQRAREISRAVLESLDVVGVLCVELFLTHDDELIINELAPRPHNSGHLTFDSWVTSQF